MLERAARCLYSRAPTQRHLGYKAAQSRRQLHFAFWRHGAADLDLRNYCLESVAGLFEQSSCPARKHPPGTRTSSVRSSHDLPFFLDVLYPPEAQDLLRRWTFKSRQHWRRKGSLASTSTGPRAYASSARSLNAGIQTAERTEQDTGVEGNDAGEKLDSAGSVDSLSILRLQDLLNAPLPTTIQKRRELRKSARQLYEGLQDPETRSRLAAPVLKLLRPDKLSTDELHVFEDLPTDSQSPETRARAVRAYLTKGSLDEAANVHDALMSMNLVKRPHIHASTALILSLFEHHRWDRMLHSFSARHGFQRRHPHLRKLHGVWLRDLPKQLRNIPRYQQATEEMLTYLESHPEKLQPGGFIPDVFLSPLFQGDSSPRTKLELLERAKRIGLSKTTHLYDVACYSVLQGTGSVIDRLETALRCYQMLRENGRQPTEGLLLKFVHEAIEGRSQALVKFFGAEWDRAIGRPDIRLSLRMMKWFARQADVASCERLIKSHRADLQHAGLGFLYPILHAEALRYGPSAVESRLQWMRDELGFAPDATCWNIYLHALARADDLEGAQAAFDQMREADVEPDSYTAGTLLGICGKRGETQLARYYLRDCISRRVTTTDVMLESVALAYINNDQIDNAIDLAETLSGQSPARAVRSWTQILAALAVRKRTDKALAVNARMNSLDVPFDGPAYAALMRVFTADGHPGMALRIMSDLMRKDKVPYAAIHYAILINGYADAGRFESGLRVHAQWLKDQTRLEMDDSLAIRVALLKLQGLAAKQQMEKDNVSLPGVRLEIAEELMHEFLEDSPTRLLNDRSPQMLLEQRTTAEAQPSAYFDALLAIYGRMQAVEMTKRLLQMLEARAKKDRPMERQERSSKVLHAIMRARYEMGDFGSVSSLWHSAIDTATTRGRNEPKDVNGLPRKLPHRQSLQFARHLDTHLLSLSSQGAMTEMFEDLRAYRNSGFILDNGNWNLYVRILAQQGYLIQAFALAENILMPGFSGFDSRYRWKMRRGASSASTPVGHFPSAVRRGAPFITYKTIQQLHDAFVELQRGFAVVDQNEASDLAEDMILGDQQDQTYFEDVEGAVSSGQGNTIPHATQETASKTKVSGSSVTLDKEPDRRPLLKDDRAKDDTAATGAAGAADQAGDSIDEELVANEAWTRAKDLSANMSPSERRQSVEDIERRAPKLVKALKQFPAVEKISEPNRPMEPATNEE